MAVPTYNTEWEQGADLVISMVYKRGTLGSETPVDLTGYSLRMDISSTATGRIYTFNSDDIADLDGSGPGNEGDTTNEAILGADGTISISIPRALTLSGGSVFTEMAAGRNIFDYDVFLRDDSVSPKQEKILSGKITVNKSVTLWA